MLYFPKDFGELTIDGLFDAGSLFSAIPETDLRKNGLLALQSFGKQGTAPIFEIIVANGPLETLKSIVELKFEGNIEIHEIFLVMETSWDRPKSTPNPRLKNSKRTLKVQSILFYSTKVFLQKSLAMPKKLKGGSLVSFGIVCYA